MKKCILLWLTCGIFFANPMASVSQTVKSKDFNSKEYCEIETNKIYDKLLKIRREFHMNPELARNESNTQKILKQYLLDLGLEVQTDIYGYGVIGILKGAKKGKSIAWRADMDALPNDFPDNVDFKSINKGVQHGCGHDVHLAIGLGIAEVLSKYKKDLQGTVYFIFQPEEESFTGAKGMVDNNLFSKIHPSELYGIHITPFPLGQILVKPNEMYAYQKGLKLEFKNTLSKDNIAELTAKIKSNLIRTSNNSKPWEIQRVLDPQDGLTNPNSIFKDYFIMDENFVSYTKNDTLILIADLYETDKSKLANIIPTIKKVIDVQGLSNQLISISFFKENPTVDNDPKLTITAVNALNEMYGQGTVSLLNGQVPFSNDDFSYFQQKVPGVYFFLGGSNFEKGIVAMIHAPNFMVDEESIKIGVKKFSSLLLQRLKN